MDTAVQLTLMLVFILLNQNFVLLKNNSVQVSFPHSEGLANHRSTLCFHEKHSKNIEYTDSYNYCHSAYVCLRSNDALKFHLCRHIRQDVHPLTVM